MNERTFDLDDELIRILNQSGLCSLFDNKQQCYNCYSELMEIMHRLLSENENHVETLHTFEMILGSVVAHVKARDQSRRVD